MSLKLKCQSNWNVTQICVSLKFECHSNWKTKYIEKVVNPKTFKSASTGQISILFFLDPSELNNFESPHESRDSVSPVSGILNG